MSDSLTKSNASPCFSPITPDAIRSALIEVELPVENAPRIAQLFDELQLALLEEEGTIAERFTERANESEYLTVERFEGSQGHSSVWFVSGAETDRYWDAYLPEDVTEQEMEVLKLASRVYANKPGFENQFSPPISPLVIRDGMHDEVVIAEPGPFQPLPSQR